MNRVMKIIAISLCVVLVLGIAGTVTGAYIRGGIDKYSLPDGFDEAMQQVDSTKQDDQIRIMTSNLLVHYKSWGGSDSRPRAKMFFETVNTYQPDVIGVQEVSDQWYNCLMRNKGSYPNNYPIIDYDFQAPISRYGVCRHHGDRLRLMHLFISDFDNEICTKQAYFPKWKSSNPTDISFLRCSIRADEQGDGYFFAGTYEKSLKYNDFKDVNVTFTINDKTVNLPSVDIKAGTMFFYPFNIKLGSVHFDYILAQPIVKSVVDGKTVCYFAECEGISPKCSVDGNEIPLDFSGNATVIDDVKIIVIPYEKAKQFHFINGKAYFLDGTVYCDNGKIYCERITDTDLKNEITFTKTSKQKLPYNYFLYSTGKRGYYELKLPKDILESRFDVVLEFDFDGLNLQVFSGKTLINDYFNIDRKFVMHLRDYKQYIESNSILIIRTAPKTKFGISNVYNEIDIPLYSDRVVLSSAKIIQIAEV